MKAIIILILGIIFGGQMIKCMTPSEEHVLQFFEGFLEGIGAEVPGLYACIEESEEIEALIVDAYKQFKSQTYAGVKQGLEDLGQIAEYLLVAVQQCKGAEQAVQTIIKIVEAFTNPWSLIFHVGMDIIVEGVNIFQEVEGAITAYEQGDWKLMGYEIGEAAFNIIIGPTNKPNMTPSEEHVLQFFEGFLEGIGAEVPGLYACIEESEEIEALIVDAYKQFKSQTYAGVKQGLEDLGQIAEYLLVAVQQCQGAEQAVQTIIKIVEAFTNPWSLIFHVGMDIIVEGVNIFQEVEGAITAYEQGDWKLMGYEIGEAAFNIIIGPTNKQNMTPAEEHALQFFEGFLEGISVEIPGLDQCIEDAEEIEQLIIQAYNDFKLQTYAGVQQGLQALGQILQYLIVAMKNCEAAEEDIQKVIKMMEAFTNPWSLVFHVGYDIIVEGVNIFQEISAAITAYEEGDWKLMGEEIGEAAWNIFIGPGKQISG